MLNLGKQTNRLMLVLGPTQFNLSLLWGSVPCSVGLFSGGEADSRPQLQKFLLEISRLSTREKQQYVLC